MPRKYLCFKKFLFLTILDYPILFEWGADMVTSTIVHCKSPYEQLSTDSVLSTLLKLIFQNYI